MMKSLFAILALMNVVSGQGIDNTDGGLRSALSSVDFNKVIKFVSPEAMLTFFAVVASTQFIIATGWLISGIFWSLLMSVSKDGTFLRSSLESVSFLMDPTNAALNVFRCIVAFAFLTLGFLIKTILTIGLGSTIGIFRHQPFMDSLSSILTDKAYLRGATGRAVLGAVFQLIVLSGFYVFLAKDRRKRRRKRWIPSTELMIQTQYRKIIENLERQNAHLRKIF